MHSYAHDIEQSYNTHACNSVHVFMNVCMHDTKDKQKYIKRKNQERQGKREKGGGGGGRERGGGGEAEEKGG